ncbi:peptidylprolyl isomerase [Gracilibacillus dipsosauri]|uniref:peptidylprolyl isomerase n=1 Tax=Gracilibacillus dipsosauri TaxID=178340 RepID=UPI0024091CC0
MRLSKLSLWVIIFILLITNITTLLFSKGNTEIALDDESVIHQKKPLATIENEKIKYEEWLDLLTRGYGEKVLTEMVNQEVVFQLAEQEELEIDSKIVEREIARLLIMQGVLTEEERKSLQEKWTEQIKYRYYMKALLTRDVEVSDSEVKQYFQTYENQYQFEEVVQLSHIVVSSEAEADEAYQKLESGASFTDVAQEYSMDEETASEGGYLGYYTETNSFIPPEYFHETLAMDEGTFSQPIRTDQGFSIVFLHHHIPAVNVSYEEAYQEVKQDLALDQMDQNLDPELLWEELEVTTVLDKND